MAELRARDSVAPWLERELRVQLRPAKAPEELWARIERGEVRQGGGSFLWMSLPMAAALMLTVAGGVAWRTVVPKSAVAGDRALAVEELRRIGGGGEGLDFRSDDPKAIREWAKTMANLDVELPSQIPAGSADVKLLGARVIQGQGSPIAAIAYQVGGGTAALVVSKKRSSGGEVTKTSHAFSPAVTTENAHITSWKMREQEYTIASSAIHDPQLACRLCHSQAQMTVN